MAAKFQEMTSLEWQAYLLQISTTEMRGPVGQAICQAIALQMDLFADRVRLGIKAKLPNLAPPDALAQIGAERSIPQGPGETNAAWATRLLHSWDTWPFGGTHQGILRALYDAGYPNAAIIQQLGNIYALDHGSTNYLLYSQDFTQVVWGTSGAGSIVSNDASITAPDGTQTTQSFTTGAPVAGGLLQDITPPSAGAFFTLSIYVIRGAYSAISGTINLTDTTTAKPIGETAFTTTTSWQRIQVTGFLPSGHGIECSVNFGSSGATLYFWGAQGELYPLATLYTKTLGASASHGYQDQPLVLLPSPRTYYDLGSPTQNPVSWAATTVYGRNTVVIPVPMNGFAFRTWDGGTSGGSQPTWPSTVGQTVTDGNIIWSCLGRDFWSRFTVVLFPPWPSSWSGTPPSYGSNEVTRIRRLINLWKSAHSTSVSVSVVSGHVLGFPKRQISANCGLLGQPAPTIWSPI